MRRGPLPRRGPSHSRHHQRFSSPTQSPPPRTLLLLMTTGPEGKKVVAWLPAPTDPHLRVPGALAASQGPWRQPCNPARINKPYGIVGRHKGPV
ncbi:unnamed protein product [Merluccius merluccius]